MALVRASQPNTSGPGVEGERRLRVAGVEFVPRERSRFVHQVGARAVLGLRARLN